MWKAAEIPNRQLTTNVCSYEKKNPSAPRCFIVCSNWVDIMGCRTIDSSTLFAVDRELGTGELLFCMNSVNFRWCKYRTRWRCLPTPVQWFYFCMGQKWCQLLFMPAVPNISHYQSSLTESCPCANALPFSWHLPGWYKDTPFPFPSSFFPFLPVNQTGVKRRLIRPLSGQQCLGDRPIVANWMVVPSPSALTRPIFPWPGCLSAHPSSLLTPSSTLLHLFSLCHCYACTSPSLQANAVPLWPYSALSSAHPFLSSIECCRASRGNSLVHCSQVNWLAQRKGLKKKKWMRRTPTLSRKKRKSTCVFLTLAAPLNSDAAAVRPDVIYQHWLVPAVL